MGKIKSTNEQLNAVVPKTITQVIGSRADDLSMTKGKYAAHIIKWWSKQGCPPVTPADEAVQILKRSKK